MLNFKCDLPKTPFCTLKTLKLEDRSIDMNQTWYKYSTYHSPEAYDPDFQNHDSQKSYLLSNFEN